MAAGKLYKDIPRMIFMIQVIEQYNNQLQLGAEDDIAWLKEKTNTLLTIKDTNKLILDFIECADLVNKYYDAIDPEWKKSIIKAIEKDRTD